MLPVLSFFLKIAFGCPGSFAVPYKFQDWLSAGKESACNAGDPGSILGSGRYPGEEIGYPLQYSWASLVAKMVKKKIHLQCTRPGFDPLVGKIPWRREWLLTPVFLPREFHGQRSLAGYSSWGHKESDMTEWLSLLLSLCSISVKNAVAILIRIAMHL